MKRVANGEVRSRWWGSKLVYPSAIGRIGRYGQQRSDARAQNLPQTDQQPLLRVRQNKSLGQALAEHLVLDLEELDLLGQLALSAPGDKHE
jgi:hypothetical protein